MDLYPLWFKMYTSCIIVRGHKQSVIYDLERLVSYSIEKEYAVFLEQVQLEDIETFKTISTLKNQDVDNFLKQFVDKELGFFTRYPNSFPNIGLEWKSPYFLSSAILEIDENFNYDLKTSFDQLNQLGCQALELRIISILEQKVLLRILKYLDKSRIRSVDIFIPFEMEDLDFFYALIKEYPRIRRICIYAANSNQKIDSKDLFIKNKISYFKKDIRVDASETIQKENFCYNISVFSESQHHNTGLNRKVCITTKGDIKNYINHQEIFGNINYKKLIDIINTKKFTHKWFIPNDKIEICKDCQFRYACVNNSDIDFEDGKYYKTDFCSFDPITNKWN